MSSDSNNSPLEDLFSSIKHYLDLRLDEIKLSLAENLAKIFSRIIFFLLFFILLGILLGVGAAALSVWIEGLIGSRLGGLLITALLFAIALFVLYLFRNRFMVNGPLRMFIKILFDDKGDGKA